MHVESHFGLSNWENNGPHVWNQVGDIIVDPCFADIPGLPITGTDLFQTPPDETDTITPAEFDAIRSQYPDLNLSQDVADYNVILIEAEELSEAALRAAIAEAGTTDENDLIVVRTTQTQNEITLSSGLSVNIDPEQYGSLNIVSFGTSPLKIQASPNFSGIRISNSTVGLGGLSVTNGGQGISSTGSMLTVTKCTLSGNTGEYARGISSDRDKSITVTHCMVSRNNSIGIDIRYAEGPVIVANCTVSENAGDGVFLYTCDSVATITNCTITENDGGGLDIDRVEGLVSVADCTISRNAGNGVFAFVCGSSVSVTKCTISENEGYGLRADFIEGSVIAANCTISGNGDGGLRIRYAEGLVDVSDCTISKNTGGGVSVESCDSTGTVTNCTITGNGGGLDIYDVGGLVSITDCTVSENAGSGVSVVSCDSPVLITNSTITKNIVPQYQGGGIFSRGCDLTVASSVISGNSAASSGGGIFADGESTVTLINSAIAGNSSGEHGGGVHNFCGLMTVTNCTITGNTAATQGGGFYIGKPTVINNSIIAKNTAASSADIEGGYLLSGGHNLIGDGAGCRLTDGVDGNIIGTTVHPVDPKFLDAENGDYRLAADSPAANKGNNQLAFEAGLDQNSLDLADKPRFAGTSIDIGAFEFVEKIVEIPEAPDRFQCVRETAHSLSLSWNSVPGASEYLLHYRRVGASSWNVLSVKDTQTLIEKLDPETVYEFRLLGLVGEVQSHAAVLQAATQVAAELAVPAYSSLPGATHTIYLDFNGHITRETYWNSYWGIDSIATPAFDLDGDASSLSESELKTIAEIYAYTAELFSPFQVNVTTVDPGIEGLRKTGPEDESYGIRVVIGGHRIEGNNTGIAVRDSFNSPLDEPAFVYSGDMYYSPDENGSGFLNLIVGTIVHEVGHTLGLGHDGNGAWDGDDPGYDWGHMVDSRLWLPIMGGSVYGSNVLHQWSRGEYAGANNREDDLAIITSRNGFGYREDTDGGILSFQDKHAQGRGIIQTSGDSDDFTLTISAAGTVSFSIAAGVEIGGKQFSGLYFYADLYSAENELISNHTASLESLKADFSVSLNPGTYRLRIGGCGYGDPVAGFSAYGSLGSYLIDVFTESDPVRPTAVIVDAGTLSVQQGCSLPLSGAGSDPLGQGLTYLWDLSGSGDFVISDETAWFHAGAPRGGSHTIRLKVRDAQGNESEIVETSVEVIGVPPTYSIDGPQDGELLAGRIGHWEFSVIDVSCGPIMKWLVNWGDGTETEILGGPRTWIFDSHFYREAKDYVITISTTDIHGNIFLFAFDAPVAENTPAAPRSVPETLSDSLSPEDEVPNATVDSQTGTPEFFGTPASFPGFDFSRELAAETMRLRQMLDLDRTRLRPQRTEDVAFSESVREEGNSFECDWFDLTGEQEPVHEDSSISLKEGGLVVLMG